MGRVGNQTPTYSWCSEYTRSEGIFAVKMADAYGLHPHPWQQLILNDWLAIGDDGKLLNSLCVLPVPRQNGKTGVIEPRETWGLVHRGERILHTAHEYQTAKIGFDRLRMKFGERKNDPHAKFPELNALVKRYTISSNQMILDLKNGAHIEFRTRGNNDDVGRGGTFDLVVVDEAQSYTDEQDAALSPLNSAAPTGSPQFIMTGTVPKPTNPHKGEKFASIRSTLHDDPYAGACIHEWGVPEIGDVANVERWYESNPSLGYQLLESALLTDSRKMSPDTFAREHLGWWPANATVSTVISEKDWNACKVDSPTKSDFVVYAVKFSPDGSRGALSACYKPKDGKPFVFVVESRSMSSGMSWFVDELTKRKDKAAQIVIDGQGNAQTLNDRLLENGVPHQAIIRPKTGDVIAACAALTNAVQEQEVTHYGQPGLDDSATKTRKRRIGTRGGWGFESTDEADATLIESACLAYWGAMTTKRKPGRKAVVF